MDGVISVLKPPGMTSHDVVRHVRRLSGVKKAGHTGTLDPGAAGVLLVCLGRATRLIEYLDRDKRYRAEVTFGAISSTGDSFGELRETGIPAGFSRELVAGVLPHFTGLVSQVPPMTSAVRHKGKRLYELARRGMVVDRKARTVEIYGIEIIRWHACSQRPKAIMDIWCSAGTYIRTLCQDMGEMVGCGAYMSFLLRTAVGKYRVDGAGTLEELEELARRGVLTEAVCGMEDVLSFLPVVEINEGAANAVSSGAVLHPPGVKRITGEIREGNLVALAARGRVMAVAVAVAGGDGRLRFKPEKVLA